MPLTLAAEKAHISSSQRRLISGARPINVILRNREVRGLDGWRDRGCGRGCDTLA